MILSHPSLLFSTDTVTLEFRGESDAKVWYQKIAHWTDNKATDGIETSFHDFPLAPSRIPASYASISDTSARGSAANPLLRGVPVESGTDVDDDDEDSSSDASSKMDGEEHLLNSQSRQESVLSAIEIPSIETPAPRGPQLQLCIMDFAGQTE
jgi:hypothetical protein